MCAREAFTGVNMKPHWLHQWYNGCRLMVKPPTNILVRDIRSRKEIIDHSSGTRARKSLDRGSCCVNYHVEREYTTRSAQFSLPTPIPSLEDQHPRPSLIIDKNVVRPRSSKQHRRSPFLLKTAGCKLLGSNGAKNRRVLDERCESCAKPTNSDAKARTFPPLVRGSYNSLACTV